MSTNLYVEILGCAFLTIFIVFVATCVIWFAVSTYNDIRKMIRG